MAYFQQNQQPPAPVWNGEDAWEENPPAGDQWNASLAEMEEEELEAMRAQRRERRQLRYRVAAGISDFMGVVMGTVVVLLLAALLMTLVNWVVTDLRDSFHLW